MKAYILQVYVTGLHSVIWWEMIPQNWWLRLGFVNPSSKGGRIDIEPERLNSRLFVNSLTEWQECFLVTWAWPQICCWFLWVSLSPLAQIWISLIRVNLDSILFTRFYTQNLTTRVKIWAKLTVLLLAYISPPDCCHAPTHRLTHCTGTHTFLTYYLFFLSRARLWNWEGEIIKFRLSHFSPISFQFPPHSALPSRLIPAPLLPSHCALCFPC